ncbi:hypothetical protein CASFOL_014233 [Castilleja foliolosa]|uniref:Glycosyltransferase n=1 Tax=Castilleja foliolosa TaxID=1961234 RepID=A0ABD3DMA3_9LAMI
MPTLMQAFQMSIPNFSQIIADLKPNLLIYDEFQPWSAKIASSLNIPSVLSATSASASLSFFHHQYTHKSFDTYPYPQIFLRDHELRNLASQGGSIEVNDNDEGFVFGIFKLSNDIVLIKGCRGIEGKYMDYLSKLCNRKIVPTGPLITKNDADESQESAEIMDWPSKKSPFSTLYISFGSEIYRSLEQMIEIVKGLEISNVNFIWVVRSPIGPETKPETNSISSVDENLPREFVDGVKRTDRGMILKEWAPQAVGDIGECVFWVPILGAPLKLDQPANCSAAVEAGVGVQMMRSENGGFDGGKGSKGPEMLSHRQALKSLIRTYTISSRLYNTNSKQTNKVSLYAKISPLGNPSVNVTPELEKWVESGNKVRFAEVQLIIFALRRRRRFAQALQGFRMDEKQRYLRIHSGPTRRPAGLIGKVRGYLQAESYFDCLNEQNKTEKVYGALLHCYARQRQTDKALSHLNYMKENGIALSAVAFIDIMSLYSNTGQND